MTVSGNTPIAGVHRTVWHMGRTELPDGPIYVPKVFQEAMPAPQWGRLLSIVDGSLNPVPVCYLEEQVRSELLTKILA